MVKVEVKLMLVQLGIPFRRYEQWVKILKQEVTKNG